MKDTSSDGGSHTPTSGAEGHKPTLPHTPTPWGMAIGATTDTVYIVAADGSTICNQVGQATAKDAPQMLVDAAFIVKAANSYDALVSALEWIETIADDNYEQDDRLRSQGARTLKRISDKARAAMAGK